MKLKLLAVAASVSALSSVAHADSLSPQPSFNDSATSVAATRGAPAVRRDFPRPSFADGTTVAEDRVVTTSDAKPVAEVLAAFPQPSSIAN